MSEDTLRAPSARFIHNFITNDVPSHDAILHKDFICIAPAGARVGRAEYLKAWATGFDAERIPYYDYRDEVIDVFGTTAEVGLRRVCGSGWLGEARQGVGTSSLGSRIKL